MNKIRKMLLAIVLCLAATGVLAQERVNINTADAATLDRVLLNIGPAKAQAIVDYRKENGAFRSIEQLALVRGIGLKTVERNRDLIVLGSGGTSAGAVAPARATLARPLRAN